MRGLFTFLLFIFFVGLASSLTIDRFKDEIPQYVSAYENEVKTDCADGLSPSDVIGGSRTIIVEADENDSGQPFEAVAGCELCPPSFRTGSFSWSVPASGVGVVTVVWDGASTGPTCSSAINYNGLSPAIDFTDGGTSDSFRIEVGRADVDAVVIITAYSGSSSKASQISFPSNNQLQVSNLLQLPFAETVLAPGATSPADFSAITALTLQITSESQVDMILKLVETASLLDLTKEGVISLDSNTNSIANPNDRITYTLNLTNAYDGRQTAIPNVIIYDDVASSTLSANPFTYFTFVPGSVSVSWFTTGLNISVIDTPDPNPHTVTVLEGNLATDRRLIVDVGTIPDGTKVVIKFTVQLTNLPCCLPLCNVQMPELPNGCLVPNQSQLPDGRTENCYCIENVGYFCSRVNGTTRSTILNQATGTTYVFDNCVPNLVERISGNNLIKEKVIIRTPVFATTDPSLTLGVNSTLAASGDGLRVTVTVNNAASRSTAPQVLTLTFPASQVAAQTTGTTNGWNCGTVPGQCTFNVGTLSANAPTQTFDVVFLVLDAGSCSFAPVSFTAVISPSGPCASPPGSNCLDSNLNNNQATVNVNVTGTPDVFVTKTPQSPSVANGGVIVYTINYGNNGNVGATGVVLTETLPPGTTYTGTGEGWSCSGSTCTASVADIPKGSSRSTTFTVTYNGPVLCSSTTIPNTISIATTCPESNRNNNQASASVTITGTPDLTITKTGTASAAVGGTATYTLTYRNQGDRAINNVNIYETLPANTAFVSDGSTGGWTCSGSTCTLPVGDLPANSNPATATIVVRIANNLACGITSATNNVLINGTCGTAFSKSTSLPLSITGQPELTISKTVTGGVTVVQPNGEVTYNISYANIGVRPAPNAKITESVPPKFSFVGPQGWQVSGSNYVWELGTVPAGASGSVLFTTKLDAVINCNEPNRDNTASISTDCVDGETNPNNNQASATVGVAGTADVAITGVNVSPSSAPVGSTITVTISYANRGSVTATNARMTVPLPARTTPGSNPTWSFSANTFTKGLGDIPPNSPTLSETLELILPTLLECNENPIVGQVNITNDCGDSNPSNNFMAFQATTTGQFDLYVNKDDFGANFTQRSSVTYTIEYGNNGVRTADNVVLTETIPNHTTFANVGSWDCPNGVTGGNTCTLQLGTLRPNDVARINVTMTIVDPIPFGVTETLNKVEIGAPGCGGDANTANNIDTEPTPVIGNPDLYVTKSDQGSTILPQDGGAVVYDITYGNIGDVDALNVVITERVPAYTVFVSSLSTDGWNCPDKSPAGTICLYNAQTVPAGSSQVIKFAVAAYSYVASQTYALRCPETNTNNDVSIAGDANQIEKSTTNNNYRENTPMGGLPNLRITKNDNIDDENQLEYKRAGQTITYLLQWSNNGPREATNAVITEVVPEYTVFNSGLSPPGWSCVAGGVAGSTCSLNVGNVAPGGSGSTTFVVVLGSFPAEATSTYNYVNITNDCGEADSRDNFDDDETPLIGFFDLIVQKHGHCRSIEWTLDYDNVGDLTSRMPYLKAHVPADTLFNIEKSNSQWVCQNRTAGSECLLALDPLPPGAGGSVKFVSNPIYSSMSTEFTLFSSIDDNLRGEDLDPTPENNYAQATIGFDGCDTCDSCCPPIDTCCPDQTDVNFNFGGVLDGLKTCSK